MGKLTVDWLTLLRESSGAAIDIAGAFLPMPGMVRDLAKLVLGEKGPESDHPGAVDGLRREIHEYHRDQLVDMEQFERGFREALRAVLGESGRLIVFVDDLDRSACPRRRWKCWRPSSASWRRRARSLCWAWTAR